ncbi:chloride channel protein [Flavobacterium sp. NRK F10]|uniref:Chloride channel protein n=1 Tax=Flavobacterium sediminis TaxID=2201181 RepID=A0A2U8QWR0_9FLAO|nr:MULTISPECIES: chloride channel protein [Flavobacterium]AWM14573.1 chloride channel protein [Flavobacterium sediminis]MCO6175817.1 chloride channel protein [Flavobacterium sp. NRK F10]
MHTKKVNPILLFIRKNVKRLERLVFIFKSLLSPRQFIYFSCVLVGISSALAVIVLKTFAHSVYKFAQYLDGFLNLPYSNSAFPIIGILLTALVIQKLLNGSLQKGTAQIMYAVAKKSGIMPRKQMYAQIITSSFTVGMGGSAGLESPITITGAAFGSNFAQNYRLSYKDRTLLLACGVAAGIAAAFNAPIAGVLFAIEVVLTEISITAFIPIMISAATGALVSTIVLNENILLSFKEGEAFDYQNIPYYILLGIISGFICVNYTRTFSKIEHWFARYKSSVYRKAFIGATLLAVLIFFFPSLFGEGYESIKVLANQHPENILDNTILSSYKGNDWVLLLFIGLTMMAKVYATGFTLGAGGNGGNFAPSLFIGSYLGFVLAKFINLIGITKPMSVSNFTLVGMAGILSGLFHAPLTAIFLIAEITGGYNLMVPLMMVSSVSFAISKRFETYSFDIKDLAGKGDVFTNDKDKNILHSLEASQFIQHNFKPVPDSNSLEQLVELIKTTDELVFPVLNDKEQLQGLIDVAEIRPVILSPFKIKYTSIQEVMQPPKEIIFYDEMMETIIEKFENSQTQILPVLKNGKFIGFMSKISILEKYREKLKAMIIE